MVDVYDDIFDENDLAALAAAAATRGFDHISVSRRGAPRTVAEAAVGAILDALGDASPFVELWWRGEAREVAVHRDVDEKACRRGERCFAPPARPRARATATCSTSTSSRCARRRASSRRRARAAALRGRSPGCT